MSTMLRVHHGQASGWTSPNRPLTLALPMRPMNEHESSDTSLVLVLDHAHLGVDFGNIDPIQQSIHVPDALDQSILQ